jgi:hypothetical protein
MIILEANYSKKIGLPGYSSHQFSVSLENRTGGCRRCRRKVPVCMPNCNRAWTTASKQIGYLPGAVGNGHANGNGNGHSNPPVTEPDRWNCSDKQRN